MKTVLITGAARGIGAAAAESFAEAGYQVVINYLHSAEKAEALAARWPGRALAVQADVADPAQVEAMFAAAEKTFGGVDVLVCNAGIAAQKLFTDVTDGEWRRMLDVHLSGAFYCCRRALPHMIHQKWGRILTVSSMWGQVGGSCEVAYSAAKAGLIGLTKSAAKELAGRNVTVNAVAPGFVETDMTASLPDDVRAAYIDAIPLKRLGTPQDIADAVAFLASPGAGYITGQVIAVNGGMYC